VSAFTVSASALEMAAAGIRDSGGSDDGDVDVQSEIGNSSAYSRSVDDSVGDSVGDSDVFLTGFSNDGVDDGIDNDGGDDDEDANVRVHWSSKGFRVSAHHYVSDLFTVLEHV
jgi:hypothetical protein